MHNSNPKIHHLESFGTAAKISNILIQTDLIIIFPESIGLQRFSLDVIPNHLKIRLLFMRKLSQSAHIPRLPTRTMPLITYIRRDAKRKLNPLPIFTDHDSLMAKSL